MGPIAKATIRTSFVLVFRLFFQAGTLLLVARMLGPEQFGVFTGVAALAILMGTFSNFGTHLVLLGEVSKDCRRRDEVLAYAVPTTLMAGGVLFLLYLIVCSLIFPHAGFSILVIACVGITEILLLPLLVFPVMNYLAIEKTASSQMLMILPLASRMLAAVCAALIIPENPLSLFVSLYMLMALLSLIALNMYSKSSWLLAKCWRFSSVKEMRRSVGYAALAFTAVSPGELDKVLAAKVLPLDASGLYATASRVINAATLPVIALLLSAMPRLFRGSEECSVKSVRLMSAIFISVFIYGLLLSGLLWVASPALEWLFGNQYAGIAEVITLFCLVIPGLVLRIAAGSILMTMDKPWVRASVEVLGVLALLILAMGFFQDLGAKSMVLAVAVSEWGMAVIGLGLSVYFRTKNKCVYNIDHS